MIGVKLNTFNDNSGEQEQDANSALTELDKGLRSTKVGEQCEAIVRFPRLFEKYPFPILINSSFLKLADVFRIGNNFLRLWVLRVCQQSEKHLDKILNVDEFLRRIFSVLHSNDPVARALALRTLGAVAGIIPERQNVHHAIRRGLDSHDSVEVDAAIYATTRFATHSNAFAVSMCNKLSDMVECESTATERRAKLVRALKNVHGGAVRAHGVLKLLRSLLERFPSSSSVRAAITAITAIAADTVVHVPSQVELLLKLATEDPRSAVRRAALLGLKKLASQAALWPQHCIQTLVTAASETQEADHTMLCLQVMQILVQCPGVCALEVAGGAGGAAAPGGAGALQGYCRDLALSVNLPQAATAADVLTTMMLHCYSERLPVEGSELMLALESLVIATGSPATDDGVKPLRVALKCLVKLSKMQPEVYAARTARVLSLQLEACTHGGSRPLGGSQPLGGSRPHGGSRQVALLEALAALGGHTHTALSPHTYNNILANAKYDESDGTALVLLCTIVFQERAAAALKYTLDPSWQHRIKEKIEPTDGWTRYRVARAALRYGHHSMGAAILERLCSEAPTESVQRWLQVLHRAASADARLATEGITGLESCAMVWETAGAGWGGAGVCGAGCGGCGACCSLRAAWLLAAAAGGRARAAVHAALTARTTQPAPAVAQAARDPAAKAGACAAAIKKAARALQRVAARYGALARTAFYADESTLRMLYISQHTYTQLAQFLERVVSSSSELPAEFPTKEITAETLEERIALVPSEAIARISAKLFDDPTTGPGITHRHTEAILACVKSWAGGAVWPRGVFAGEGGAACRLSVSPAARAPPADHRLDHHLALKLDGVILRPPHTKRRKLREVKGVQLTVTATPHPRSNEKSVELTNVPPALTAVQTVTPLRDFFSAQQLVSVSSPGFYTVAVEAAFVDESGELWNTGPRTCLVVKAHEDPSSKGNAQTARSRF